MLSALYRRFKVNTFDGQLKCWAALIIIAPGLIAMAILAFHDIKEMKKNRFQELEQVLAFQKDAIDSWFTEQAADVQQFAISRTVRNLEYDDIRRDFRGFLQRNPEFSSIVFVDKFGKVIVGEPRIAVSDASDRDYYKKALEGKSHITDVMIGRVSGEPIIIFSSPVYGYDDDFQGLVFGAVKVATIDRIMTQFRWGKTGETYLVNKDGRLITESRFTDDMIRQGRVRKTTRWELDIDTEGLQNALQGINGAHVYTNFRGKKVLGAYRWLENRNWALIGEVDEEELLAPIYRELAYIFGGYIFLLLCLWPLTIHMSKAITGPVKQLAAGAGCIKSGEFAPLAPLPQGRAIPEEIVHLHVMFEEMIDTIKRSYKELEFRVRERTVDLAKANITLQQEINERRQAEERYRLLFNNGYDGVSVCRLSNDNSPGRFIEVNDVACRVLDYTREELLNMGPEHIVAPDKHADILTVQESLCKGLPLILETTCVTKSGARIPFEISAQVFSLDGEMVALIISRDIRERKQTEALSWITHDLAMQILRELPLRYILQNVCKRLTQFFDLGVATIGHKEADGSVKIMASAGRAATCLRNVQLRWDEGPEAYNSEGRAIRTGKTQIVQTGGSGSTYYQQAAKEGLGSFVSIPLVIRGEVIGMLKLGADQGQSFSSDQIAQFEDFAGQVAIAINAASNRKKLGLLTTALESAVNAVLITDQELYVQWMNEAFLSLSGCEQEEIFGKNISQFWLNDPKDIQSQHIRQDLRNGKSWHGQLSMLRADGTDCAVEMTVTPVCNDFGVVTNYIAIMQDIQERKAAEQQMLLARQQVATAEKLASLGTMAAGIAHEINQPLNSLKVTADSLLYWHRKGRPLSLNDILDDIKNISLQADRIDKIIKHMRAMVRKDRVTHDGTTNLNKAIRDALDLMNVQVKKHGIVLKTRLARKLPSIAGDHTHFEGVVVNLVLNAIQALDILSRKDKEIMIETWFDEAVFMQISDNGPGIDETIRDKIFNPFFTTKPIGDGMGLGLSIVQSVVSQYEGSITAENNSTGGATFRIQFPIFSASTQKEEQS